MSSTNNLGKRIFSLNKTEETTEEMETVELRYFDYTSKFKLFTVDRSEDCFILVDTSHFLLRIQRNVINRLAFTITFC